MLPRRLILVALVGLGLSLALDLGDGLGAGLGLGPRAAFAEPQVTERKVEVLTHRPSGFWTSNRPAVGGAYRWRLLGIGVVLAAGAGYMMWRLTRRANAERIARNKAP
jgi:hypothetical protein